MENSDIVADRIHDVIAREGSKTRAGAALGVSDDYLRQVLNGQRPPSDRLLAALGLQRRILPVDRDYAPPAGAQSH